MHKHLYLLTSPLLPGFCKIGIANDVQKRIDGLYGKWEVYHSWQLPNALYVEGQMKIKLRRFVAHGFELLNCPVEFVHEEIVTFLHEDLVEPIPVVQELPKDHIFKITEPNQLGALMKQARKESGITQNDLRAATTLGLRFIRESENGKATCEIGKVLLALRMLGIHIFLKLP